MQYLPGTHILATLHSDAVALLSSCEGFRQLADELIAQFDLCRLGEVYHNFQPAGFTGVICLSESHISIHTWPEYNRVNLDIYLSNYQRDNDGTVKAIYEKLVQYFEADIVHEQTLKR